MFFVLEPDEKLSAKRVKDIKPSQRERVGEAGVRVQNRRSLDCLHLKKQTTCAWFTFTRVRGYLQGRSAALMGR